MAFGKNFGMFEPVVKRRTFGAFYSRVVVDLPAGYVEKGHDGKTTLYQSTGAFYSRALTPVGTVTIKPGTNEVDETAQQLGVFHLRSYNKN